MDRLGLGIMIAAVAAYLGPVLFVRRTYSTRYFDAAIVVGAGGAGVGWLVGGSVYVLGATCLIAALWFVLTRRELWLHPTTDVLVEAGSTVPGFRVQVAGGGLFTEADLIAAAPALLVAYRGGGVRTVRPSLSPSNGNTPTSVEPASRCSPFQQIRPRTPIACSAA